jgi:hypothetical protein
VTKRSDVASYPDTPDGRYFVVRGPVGVGRVLRQVPIVVRCAVVPSGGAALAQSNFRLIDHV